MSKAPKNLNTRSHSTHQILDQLRKKRTAHQKTQSEATTIGERASDAVTKIVGSWTFIIAQSVLIFIWMLINIVAWLNAWDPYPFILLNLVLSFQAAFTAPIIMMSQNRQNIIDRQRAESDYDINIKAELEIEQLHVKLDLLRTKEIKQLIDIIQSLEKKIGKS